MIVSSPSFEKTEISADLTLKLPIYSKLNKYSVHKVMFS